MEATTQQNIKPFVINVLARKIIRATIDKNRIVNPRAFKMLRAI